MLGFFRRKKPDTPPKPGDAPGGVDATAQPVVGEPAPEPPAQPDVPGAAPASADEPVPAEIIAAALDMEPAMPAPVDVAGAIDPAATAADEAAAPGKKGWRDRLRGSA